MLFVGRSNAALVCIPGRDFSSRRGCGSATSNGKSRRPKTTARGEEGQGEGCPDEKLRKKDPVAADKKQAREEAKSDQKKEAEDIRHCRYYHCAQRPPTALLTLVNAADLLERNTYVTPAQKRQQGAKKEPVVKVSRTRGPRVVQSFKLVDDPRRLSDSDWKKVVAVVAQGAAWQFKGWKVSQRWIYSTSTWACILSTTTARLPKTSRSERVGGLRQ